jgi:hypothetical protein
MVLESRQIHAGENPPNDQGHASKQKKAALTEPKQMAELSHQNGVVEDDQFQQDLQSTELYEPDELVMQPEMKCQKPSTVTNYKTIKALSDVEGRRERDFINESKEISNTEEFQQKPNNKVKQTHCPKEQKQGGTCEGNGSKPLTMTRAQLYAALSETPEQDGRRANPNKGKFFFGSTLRLYGGSRWSELRKKAHDELAEKTVATCQEFELEEDISHKPKRAKCDEPSILGYDTTTIADEEPSMFTTLLENQSPHQQISGTKGYEGNWKASGPAFIVVTNALFTLDC